MVTSTDDKPSETSGSGTPVIGSTPITAYTAKPSGGGPFPGVVLVHHLPGWSELYIETTRRLAHHGYMAICANLYQRAGDGGGVLP